MITEQEITIYNKLTNSKWKRTNLKGTFRNTSIQNRTLTGSNTNDNGLLRIFDTKDFVDYNEWKNNDFSNTNKWTVQTGDVIVDRWVDFEFEGNAPITALQKEYGREHVLSVISFDDYRKGTSLDHIKIGLK